jgi:hypothetical protein
MKERERHRHPPPLRPAAAMAGLRCSLENFDFPDFNHQTTHSLHQSKAELNTNTSMRLRTSMTDRGWSTARDDDGAMAGSLETRKPTIRSTKSLKKSMRRNMEGWQPHQSKEKRREKNSKLHRWKAAKPRVAAATRAQTEVSACGFDLETKGGGLALAYIELGYLNLDQNPRKNEFDSVKIASKTGSVTTQRRETRLTCGSRSSAKLGGDARTATTSWVGPCYRCGRAKENGCSARQPNSRNGEEQAEAASSRPPSRRLHR